MGASVGRGRWWRQRLRRPFGLQVLVTVAFTVAFAVVMAGCTERTVDELPRDVTPASTVPPSPGGASTDTAPVRGAAFMARVAKVDAGDLRLGAAFNAQFLTLQFLAVGLDGAEAKCSADRIAAASGTEFATRPVNQVMSGAGITPEVLLPCVSTARMMDLSKAGSGVDLSRVPPDVLRSTLTELASAGYETVGLTPVEATCLADRVVGTYTDGDLVGLMTSLSLPADRAVAAIPECVSPARANELGA